MRTAPISPIAAVTIAAVTVLSCALPEGIEVLDDPLILGVSPAEGPAAGGTDITVTGTGFNTDGATLSIDGTEVAEYSQRSATMIVGETVGGSPGLVDVVVTNSDGGTATDTDGFRYLSNPVVNDVAPPWGSTMGGTSIDISGMGFLEGADVFVDGNEATTVVVENGGLITAETPPGTEGLREVEVVNPDGESDTESNGFEYVVFPDIDESDPDGAISPASGSTAGGTQIILRGTNFEATDEVLIGGELAIEATPSIDQEGNLRRVTPASGATATTVPDDVDIEVRRENGRGEDTLVNGFRYTESQPTILSVEDMRSPGQTSTITGTDFHPDVSVTFGGVLVSVFWVSGMEIEATVPPGNGTVQVSVTNPDGGVDTDNATFTYE